LIEYIKDTEEKTMEFEKIKQIISRELKIDENKITLETSLVDLGVDSIDGANIAINIEEEFGIEITDTELSEMKTIGDMVNIVSKKK
jgi:acyl carrier protein